MDLETIVKVITAVASFLVATLIPSIIALVKYVKSYKAAKTEAEKQAVYNDLRSEANKLIAAAEETYKQVDNIIKQQGGKGSGNVKKDSVMTKLQAYCVQKGIDFDSEYWSGQIDEIVELTKKVNAKGA